MLSLRLGLMNALLHFFAEPFIGRPADMVNGDSASGASGRGEAANQGGGGGAAGNIPASQRVAGGDATLTREIKRLKQRLVQEATFAVGMLETATDALLRLDVESARAVIRRDDEIDREEVIIEEECLRLLALFQPFARDFRTIATLLRVNADLERVGDHATSIAKVTIKLHERGGVPQWPTSLQELTQRVPMLCHALLNSLLSESVEDARAIFEKDKAIDKLDKRLFEECLDAMSEDRDSKASGLLMYRCGRELERVGDLMTNIAEDVVYLVTGSIVRHDKNERAAVFRRQEM